MKDLRGCLQALEVNRSEVNLDVVVIDRLGDSVASQVRSEFPQVRLISAPPETTIPDLRAMGIQEARADAVAVIEDHVLTPPGWARQMIQALGKETQVIGGSIENAATETLVDWAAFLCEYSACLPPMRAGPTDWLPGNNTIYPRSLLERFRSVVESGQWENHLHDTLRHAGIALVCCPEIVVGHKMHYSVWEYTTQRYYYARAFAGMRAEVAAPRRRLVFRLAAFLLPPVLFWRTVARIWPKVRYRRQLLKSLPLLVVFVTAWGLGEVVGYWAGPGDALRHVR